MYALRTIDQFLLNSFQQQIYFLAYQVLLLTLADFALNLHQVLATPLDFTFGQFCSAAKAPAPS